VIGVAGFVVPGMHVDILISGNKPGTQNTNLGTVTKTLLQNIEVLSAGQDFKKDAEGKPVMVQVINLLVTPQQAEELSLASAMTTIQLVLRNPLDREVAKTNGAAMGFLFNNVRGALPETPPAAAPRPRPVEKPVVAQAPPKKETFTMEIVQGNKKTEAKFESNGEGK
jgi:pilus assembly protein CpaB